MLLYKRIFKETSSLELLSGSALPFTLKIAGILFSYFFAFFISLWYGADGLGIFSLCTTMALFFVYIFKFGFDTALLKFTAEHKARSETHLTQQAYLQILKIIVPTGIILSLCIAFNTEFISKYFFHKPYLKTYLLYTSFLILPNILFLINSEGLRGLGKNKEYVFIQNLGVFLISTLLLIGASHFFEKSNLIPIKVYVLSVVIVFSISSYLWYKEIFNEKSNSNSFKLKTLIDVAAPMFWANSMIVIIGWTDTIMLGIFKDEHDVGIYNVALKISNVIILPLTTINGILAPKYADLYIKNNLSGLEKLVAMSAKILFFISCPLFIGLILFNKFLLGLFGNEFIEGSKILIILATGQYINAICGSTDVLLQMTGNEKLFRNIIVFATTVNVILNYFLIPVYGMTGAAFASLMSLICWNFLSVIFIKKRLNIKMLYFQSFSKKYFV